MEVPAYQNVLITGGCGFVGSSLARVLWGALPKSSRITVLDNLRRPGSDLNARELTALGVIFIHGDVRNQEDLSQVGAFDLLIDCAAEPAVTAGLDSSAEYVLNTNLNGTINSLEMARKYRADVVFMSTSRVYPIEALRKIKVIESKSRFVAECEADESHVSDKGIRESFPLVGARSLYGTSKLASELLVEEYGGSFGLRTIVNRCGVVSGPGQFGKQDQGFVSYFAAQYLWGSRLEFRGFSGSGKQVRDVLHIDDLAAAILMQCRDFGRFSGNVFNLSGGSDFAVSLRELAEVLEELTGSHIAVKSALDTHTADVAWLVLDSAKFMGASGWSPKFGVRRTAADVLEWLRSRDEELRDRMVGI